MKYIVKKTTYFKNQFQGFYYMTKVVSIPNNITDLTIKTAFDTYNEAHQYMIEVINRDYPFKKKGFKFEYEIVEVK